MSNNYKLYRIVSAIIINNHSVLLVKSGDNEKAVWGLPGGQVEGEESLEEAVIREVLEETGMDAVDLELAYIHESYIPQFNAHSLVTAFRVHASSLKFNISNDPDNEIIDICWVDFEKINQFIANKQVASPLLEYINNFTPKYYLDRKLAWIE
ncbi:hypothetical protein PA598K_04018 [Paenibacillus sp. 598K]|uniref:NUDIX domain-containing protein n=1 Tax=Paenibacillus sp. 598K TaxID=1117987 RepID=UPI000FF98E61|nr:NUDIX hydrolase [Paenibacillus sp. 598K]GBF75600.1 hypothetical protein PA598K_04018 [Paenibacillus sp. 598K]